MKSFADVMLPVRGDEFSGWGAIASIGLGLIVPGEFWASNSLFLRGYANEGSRASEVDSAWIIFSVAPHNRSVAASRFRNAVSTIV